MYEKLTIRIPQGIHQRLEEKSEELGIKITQVIRNHLIDTQELQKENEALKKRVKDLEKLTSDFQNNNQEKSHLLLRENNILLRELSLAMPPKILRKSDIKNKQKFGDKLKTLFKD